MILRSLDQDQRRLTTGQALIELCAREIAILNKWAEFYNAGTAVIKARTDLARAHSELTQVDLEGEIAAIKKDAEIEKHLADIEESRTRAAEARQNPPH